MIGKGRHMCYLSRFGARRDIATAPKLGFAMPIVGLDHIQLAMPPGGEDEARAFYGTLLGIDEVPKPPHLAARGGCWFERDACKVHLGVDTDFRPARKAHPGFVVRDLDQLVIALEANGYSVDVDQNPEGYERRYVDDPFGNRIELIEPVVETGVSATMEGPSV